MKKLHYIQHIPYESPGSILSWAQENKLGVSSTRLYDNENYPDLETIDCLVVMGGPMSANDEKDYPWLRNEKLFIEKVMKADKVVVGICLGAQLVANVLGSKITRNQDKEIGWYPIKMTSESRGAGPFKIFPDEFTVFHWHGETFDIPRGAIRIAESAGCANQGFLYSGKVVGLQFHLEVTKESIEQMVASGKNELKPEQFVQDGTQILSNTSFLEKNNELIGKLLTQFKSS